MIRAALTSLGNIVKGFLTGPDNKSWAPGRLMGFLVFGVGQVIVVRSACMVWARRPNMADLIAFLGGISTFEAAICGTVAGLIMLVAPADPGGAWWQRSNSPPPPPTTDPH